VTFLDQIALDFLALDAQSADFLTHLLIPETTPAYLYSCVLVVMIVVSIHVSPLLSHFQTKHFHCFPREAIAASLHL